MSSLYGFLSPHSGSGAEAFRIPRLRTQGVADIADAPAWGGIVRTGGTELTTVIR